MIVGATPEAARDKFTSSPATEFRATEAFEYNAANVRQRGYDDMRELVGKSKSSAPMR
jgi:hypothetical protein